MFVQNSLNFTIEISFEFQSSDQVNDLRLYSLYHWNSVLSRLGVVHLDGFLVTYRQAATSIASQKSIGDKRDIPVIQLGLNKDESMTNVILCVGIGTH